MKAAAASGWGDQQAASAGSMPSWTCAILQRLHFASGSLECLQLTDSWHLASSWSLCCHAWRVGSQAGRFSSLMTSIL